MLYIQSTNANDGSMAQVVTFDVGTDPDIDNVLVNNRFSQAQPFLPQDVKNFGVTIKKSLAFPLMVISLYSPDGRYDASFLTNYANINVNDALLRVRASATSATSESSDYAMRVWLNPTPWQQGADGHRRAERRSITERREPGRADRREPSPPGQQLTYTVRAQGRLVEAEEFGNIMVRQNPDGSTVRTRRRPHRARLPQLPAGRHVQRQAGRGHRRVPDARARTRSTSPATSTRR